MSESDPLWTQIHTNDSFSIYHTKYWKNFIEGILNHTAVYLSASKDGMLIDVLPFFLIKKKFLGGKLISTPYDGCNGGFTCNDAMVRKQLIEQIKQYANSHKVRYVEIRSKFEYKELKELGFAEKRPLIISELPLKDLAENWNMLSTKHRRNVRIAQKTGVTVELASSLTEMRIFYKILANHYKQLGVPIFNEIFFIQIWLKLIETGHASLLISKYKEEIIGGHLLFYSGKTLISKYSACKKNNEFKKVYASYALFWEGIRLGIDRHYKYFNLGISDKTNKGLLDFKTRFGSQSSPLYFYYYPISGRIPDYSKYLSSYSLPQKAWRVAPKFITSFIGRKINEWIC
jgi:hypothetical protein